jgi:hypothetical protein
MAKDIKINTDAFWQNGYLLIRDVFSKAEIEELRKHVLEVFPNGCGDILSKSFLREVLLDDRVLNIAQKILGGTPVYFGDSSCNKGNRSYGWHKDNADRKDANAPDWQSKYTLVRFGLYLQDHSKHSGGLNVKARSHNSVSEKEGRTVYLATRLGDLVVWNLRTTHSGNGLLLRFFHSLHLDPRRALSFPRSFMEKEERERLAIFFTLGLDDHHLQRYIALLKTRKYMVENWKAIKFDANDVQEAVKGKSLIVREVWEEIKGETGLGMNKDYAPIPY